MGRPNTNFGESIIIYGEGGIGKTELCTLAPDPVFINTDCDHTKKGMREVVGVECWQDIRDALHCDEVWESCKTIVLDTATVAQSWAEKFVIENIAHEKGHAVTGLDGYGWGKGPNHVADQFSLLMGDFDAHKRKGRNVVIVCHAVTDTAPNPDGEDYIRYEPDLQQPKKSGRVRDAMKNWCDHMLFISQDISVEEGKVRGGGSRTIYGQALPHFWAKSRTLEGPIVYTKGSCDLWEKLWKDS